MEYLAGIKGFTIVAGGVVALGYSYSAYVDYKRQQVTKLANNVLSTFAEAKNVTGTDGLIISKNIQLKEKYDFEGVGVIGSTGSGKTTKLFVPNLLSNNIRGSIVVTDPSGELFELTSKYQKEICGRKVYKIDLNNPNYSDKFNILENCQDAQEVLQLASSLLYNGSLAAELLTGKKAGGIEWVQMAQSLMASTLLYARDLKYPFNNVEFAVQLILTLKIDQLKLLIENSNNLDAINQFNIFMMVQEADRTEGSIKITLSTNMSIFTDKKVNNINSKSTFDIERFRQEESILYISYKENKAIHYSPFLAPLYNVFIDKIIDSYKKESLPIHLLFEEFANIGMINNMAQNLATCRKRKVNFTLCLQSISQLNQIYGQFNAKSILNNLKTKVIYPGNSDLDTLNYMSSLCGSVEINTMSTSKADSKETNSYTKTKRKMFEDGELRTMEEDKALVIIANKQAILDETEMYFNDVELAKNVFKDTVTMYEDKMTVSGIDKELKKLKLTLAAALEKEEENAREGLFRREV